MCRARAQRSAGRAEFALRGIFLAASSVFFITSVAVAQQIDRQNAVIIIGPADSGAPAVNAPMVAMTPATQPTADSTKIEKWLTDLNDRTPAARDEAICRLYELSRGDLPALQEIIRKTPLLSPMQIEVLRDVVMQAYLSGEPYAPNTAAGNSFMGARMGIFTNANGTSGGVMVLSRVPGFGAYRSLRDGDVILAIIERPNTPIDQTGNFILAIQQFSPGDTLHMRVLRQGKVVTATVQLAVRPQAMSPFMEGTQFTDDRSRLAAAYLQKNFPLLAPDETADAN